QPVAMGDAPAPGPVGGPGAVRSGALPTRPRPRPATLRLFPLQRRPAPLHRRALRAPRGAAHRRDDAAALRADARRSTGGRDRTDAHAAPPRRPGHVRDADHDLRVRPPRRLEEPTRDFVSGRGRKLWAPRTRLPAVPRPAKPARQTGSAAPGASLL